MVKYKALLTGGTGFLGKNFLEELLKDENFDYVKIFTRNKKKNFNSKKIKYLKKKNIKSINRKDILGLNTLIHLSAEGVVKNKQNFKKIINHNYYESKKLIELCLKSNIKFFFISGSCFEYGFSGNQGKLSTKSELIPFDFYSLSKVFFFNWLKSLNLKKKKFFYARFFNLYGNYESKKRLYPQIKNINKKIVLKYSRDIRDFIEIKRAIRLSIKKFKKNRNHFSVENIRSNKPKTVLNFVKENINTKLYKKYIIVNNKNSKIRKLF